MSKDIEKITFGIAAACKECIKIAVSDPLASKEILRGGGSSGGIMTRLLMPRPINSIRISEDALKLCLDNGVLAFDYFILTASQKTKKYKHFFSSNFKTIEGCHEVGHYLTGDHNIPNKEMIKKMIDLCKKNPNATIADYKEILDEQSYDLITLEENKRIDDAGFKDTGTKEERDGLCSPKIEFVDLWLTPREAIDGFFKVSKLNKAECMDPCASDGRWLDGKGYSIDILPMKKRVCKKDFLTIKKEEIPKGIKTIVGNLPFSLLDEFVKKALELFDDCYFLVNGDTIFDHFSKNIEHVYIFSGLEGNQKDNRSRCEFDVPFLIKSALWCCIVHITKKEQDKWTIQKDLTKEERRDGYHIALGKNVFIKTNCPVDEDPRISRIAIKSRVKK